ncbi:hypothetical protein SH584_08925 [Sphingomonas sp. LY29]|uniref:ATP-grasp domain-containing protein n=1 Tax=Sphingomonas sp. LY29 TaxID=3095341 RepID=UPI002D775723|nr:hypothetical protein [Sphingomonas sp. LY29]WRP25170.1 hypothetical protein SH584_08925 [Sphingomonas sp. LY29]
MRAIVLTPAADYPDPWDWAYGIEARALEAAGFVVEPRAWTDPGDVAGADAVLPLVAWGYDQRVAEWHALLDRAEAEGWPMINAARLLRWNTDKAYLAELGAKGISVVPTRECMALSQDDIEAAHDAFGSELVIKPPVSASAVGTHRVRQGDSLPTSALGQRMLIQPFQKAIERAGEYSLMMFAGELGHAIVKRPKSGDFRVQPHLGGKDSVAEPPSGALELAQSALAAAPELPTYARVDMIETNEGGLAIMEIELIEPALFLHQSADSAALFGRAIAGAAKALRTKE